MKRQLFHINAMVKFIANTGADLEVCQGHKNMLFRLINVLISLIIAYLVHVITWSELYSYLPSVDKLQAVNNSSNLSAILRENSMGLRELYKEIFERSLLYAFVTFITSLFVLSYIKAGNWIVYYFKGMPSEKQENKGIDIN